MHVLNKQHENLDDCQVTLKLSSNERMLQEETIVLGCDGIAYFSNKTGNY